MNNDNEMMNQTNDESNVCAYSLVLKGCIIKNPINNEGIIENAKSIIPKSEVSFVSRLCINMDLYDQFPVNELALRICNEFRSRLDYNAYQDLMNKLLLALQNDIANNGSD